jgi:hypothetical protein
VNTRSYAVPPDWLANVRLWRLFRLALIADLLIYLFSVMWFAFVPLFPTVDGSENELSASEAVIGITGFIPMVWMVSRMLGWGWYWDRWGYLTTAGYGLFTIFAFDSIAIFSNTLIVSWQAIVTINLWLFSGVVGAGMAHLVDGGTRSVREALRIANEE